MNPLIKVTAPFNLISKHTPYLALDYPPDFEQRKKLSALYISWRDSWVEVHARAVSKGSTVFAVTLVSEGVHCIRNDLVSFDFCWKAFLFPGWLLPFHPGIHVEEPYVTSFPNRAVSAHLPAHNWVYWQSCVSLSLWTAFLAKVRLFAVLILTGCVNFIYNKLETASELTQGSLCLISFLLS